VSLHEKWDRESLCLCLCLCLSLSLSFSHTHTHTPHSSVKDWSKVQSQIKSLLPQSPGVPTHPPSGTLPVYSTPTGLSIGPVLNYLKQALIFVHFIHKETKMNTRLCSHLKQAVTLALKPEKWFQTHSKFCTNTQNLLEIRAIHLQEDRTNLTTSSKHTNTF
jgi:hypothetical protein